MKRWAAIYGIGVIALIVLADTDRLGFLNRVYDFRDGDKAGHFLVFGLLSLLVNLSAFEQWPFRNAAQLALRVSVMLAVPIGLEELSQRWISTRVSSVLDLAASYLGVTAFAWLAVQIARRKRALDRGTLN
jgi:VanZ family protein